MGSVHRHIRRDAPRRAFALGAGRQCCESGSEQGSACRLCRGQSEDLGLILDEIEGMDAVFILFAVHGMTRDMSRTAVTPFVMDRVNLLHRSQLSPAAAPRQRSLMRYLRRVVPAPIQHAIGQLVPVGVRDWVVQGATAAGHDWSRTPGLALLADRTGYIRLNRQGREAEEDSCPRGVPRKIATRPRSGQPFESLSMQGQAKRSSPMSFRVGRSFWGAGRLFARLVCDLAGE